jgi:hypothetical protein
MPRATGASTLILPGPTSVKGTTWLFTPTGSIELSPSYDGQEWAIESNYLDLINEAHEALAQDNHRSRSGSPADRPVALAIYVSLCANKETFIVYLCNAGKSGITDVTDKGSSVFMPEVIELAQEEDISWSSAAAILSEREITESGHCSMRSACLKGANTGYTLFFTSTKSKQNFHTQVQHLSFHAGRVKLRNTQQEHMSSALPQERTLL